MHFEEIDQADAPDFRKNIRGSQYTELYAALGKLPEGKVIRIPAQRASATAIQANVSIRFSREDFRIRSRWHKLSDMLYLWKEARNGR